MKQNKTDIRPYTKAFYRGNRLPFLAALVCTLLMSLVSLMVSWLLQQLLDLMGAMRPASPWGSCSSSPWVCWLC